MATERTGRGAFLPRECHQMVVHVVMSRHRIQNGVILYRVVPHRQTKQIAATAASRTRGTSEADSRVMQ